MALFAETEAINWVINGLVIVGGAFVLWYQQFSKIRSERMLVEAKAKAEEKASEHERTMIEAKAKAEEKASEHERRREELLTALDAWKTYAAKVEEARRQDFESLSRDVREMRAELLKCQENHSDQRVEIVKWKATISSMQQTIQRLQARAGEVVPISSIPAVVTATDGGEVIDVTVPISAILHYEPKELVGKNVSMLLPERSRGDGGVWEEFMDLNRPQDEPIVTFALARDGSEVPVAVYVHPWVGAKGQKYLTAYIYHHPEAKSDSDDRRSGGLKR